MIYDENGSLIGFNYDNKEYFIDRDITGNINRIIDEIGAVYVTYIYNAYGKVQSKINSNLTSDYIQIANNLLTMNVMLYKGYCYDRETGLYYCKTRYYSPELCRWISPDSIEYLDAQSINGLNLYCYCKNNPISYADPSGLNPMYLFKFLFTNCNIF